MTEEEKKETVDGFVELVCQNIIDFYTMMGLDSYIHAHMLNVKTNEMFEFSFKKIEFENKTTEDGTQGTPLQQG